jgi:hypothetical protein
MHDALQAIQWAFVFCEYADEPTAGRWVEYWIKTARNKSNFEAVKSMYEIASWRLATEMRTGATFTAVTKDILADTGYLNDLYSDNCYKPTKFEERPGKGRRRWESQEGKGQRQAKVLKTAYEKGTREGKGKGADKARSEGKGAKRHKGGKDSKNGRSRSRQPRETWDPIPCRDFNSTAGCARQECKFDHICANCWKPRHTAESCRQPKWQ